MGTTTPSSCPHEIVIYSLQTYSTCKAPWYELCASAYIYHWYHEMKSMHYWGLHWMFEEECPPWIWEIRNCMPNSRSKRAQLLNRFSTYHSLCVSPIQWHHAVNITANLLCIYMDTGQTLVANASLDCFIKSYIY